MNIKRKLNQWRDQPFMAYGLVVIAILMFCIRFVLPVVTFHGFVSVNTLLTGQIGSFILSAFNELSVSGLVMDGLILYFVGGQLEQLVGHWRILAIYLLSGLAGLVTQGLFLGTDSMTTTISMAVLGIFGGFLMLGDAFKESAVLGQVARQYWLFLILSVGLQVIFNRNAVYGMLGEILGGFLSAMALGAPKVGKINPVNRIISGVVYVVAIILFAYLGMNR